MCDTLAGAGFSLEGLYETCAQISKESMMVMLKVDSEWAARNIRAQGMGGEPRIRTGDNQVPKLAPNGKPTYASGVVVARPEGGVDRGVSIAVTEPAVLPLGVALCPAGDIWVTPYESNGRVALSIVCDRLVPLAQVKGREA
ncbi:hypothetical protein [Microbacterium sp. RG1]|uniref:hypothetical protein n=1 Tax=Microbacterium sp. RG1 TaxID=2489212 RepID=UPI0010CA5389|nr:hypothetical protein [Microbacterium sp. RG1]QCQ17248.1 hypothetical protein EHF32_11230 [Microbacterium sp. RG1]